MKLKANTTNNSDFSDVGDLNTSNNVAKSFLEREKGYTFSLEFFSLLLDKIKNNFKRI